MRQEAAEQEATLTVNLCPVLKPMSCSPATLLQAVADKAARQEAAAEEAALIEAAGGHEEWLRQQRRPSNAECPICMADDPDVVVGACGHGACKVLDCATVQGRATAAVRSSHMHRLCTKYLHKVCTKHLHRIDAKLRDMSELR